MPAHKENNYATKPAEVKRSHRFTISLNPVDYKKAVGLAQFYNIKLSELAKKKLMGEKIE